MQLIRELRSVMPAPSLALGRVGALCLTALALCLAPFPSLAGAEGEEPALLIDPGQWRFRTVSKMPLNPHPQSRTTTECVRDGRRTAEQLATGSSPGCKFSDVVISEDTMKWRLTCDQGGGKLTGDAVFRSTGKAVEGALHMKMEHGGMKLAFEHTITGTRTGDCD